MAEITMTGQVPCAGCTACCRGQLIVLFPEHGDDPTQFDTRPMGNGMIALKEQANGDCIYLGADGCTIHERAPMMCRRFDCRDMVRGFGSRRERRAALADGRLSKEIHDAGMARMATLC